MFERYTERARQVVVLAQEEARNFKHGYIGTEHILVGLLREEEGLAARVLKDMEVTVERARAQTVRITGTGTEKPTGQVPFTPRAQKVLEMALREALAMGHNYIGTEHVLLALARDPEGVGARILRDFLKEDWAETIWNEVIRMLSGPTLRTREPLPEELTYDMVRTGLGKLAVRHRTQPGFRGILTGYDWGADRCTVSYTQPVSNGIRAEWSAGRLRLCVCDPAEVQGWKVVLPSE